MGTNAPIQLILPNSLVSRACEEPWLFFIAGILLTTTAFIVAIAFGPRR